MVKVEVFVYGEVGVEVVSRYGTSVIKDVKCGFNVETCDNVGWVVNVSYGAKVYRGVYGELNMSSYYIWY